MTPHTARAGSAPAAGRRSEADEQDLRRRIAGLSLDEKVGLLTGGDFWSIRSKASIGLRRVVVSDGPAGSAGSAGTSVTLRERALPDGARRQLGRAARLRGRPAAGAEARRKGVDVLLAPTLNLLRTAYGGRNFECFSEDPLLTSRIGAAYVGGVQSGGVAATAKHFVANESETERHTVDVRVDDRTLHELYLAPFEAAVRGGAWAAMASYNRVNGDLDDRERSAPPGPPR